MNLTKLYNGKHWNARPTILDGKQATEFHVGFVNYLNGDDTWAEIDCTIIDTGDGFVMYKAPFECTFPKYADGEAIFHNNNRFDVFTKTLIDCAPFDMTMVALDASHAQGQIFDINGDGRLDAVLYPQAFPQWDADLIYYVQHGIAPRLQKLIRFNSALGSNVQAEFYLEYTDGVSNDVEISSRTIPNGKTRMQWRDECRNTLNTPAPVGQAKGFYIRAKDETQKRGIGIKEIKIWDSSEERKEESITANIHKSGVGYKLTKHINKSFFNDAVFPCYTDAISTFYPDPHPETTSFDGRMSSGDAASWDTVHNAATAASASDSDVSLFCRTGIEAGNNYRIYRSIILFDTSALPDADTIASATLGLYVYFKEDGDNDGDNFSAIVQSNPALNTAISINDYNQVGSTHSPTEGADRISITGVSAGAYMTHTLDATGLSWIDKAGITKLGWREGHDIVDSAYVGAVGTRSRLQADSADVAGTATDPKLVLVHSPAGITILRRRREGY